MPEQPRLLRITTASISLKLLLRGQFTFFQQQGFEVLTVSADGPEVQDLLAEGVPHQVVPMTRRITPFQDVICLWKLIKVISKFKPDIVHTHTPKAGLLGMMAARVCRVPVRLHTVAGLPLMEANGVKRWVLKITERITYACAHQVYPNSLGLLQFILKEFQISDFQFQPGRQLPVAGEAGKVPGSKFQVIGRGSSNGIESTYYLRTPELEATAIEIRKQYHISETAIVFGFVGRIVKDKGIVELVDAFRKLADVVDVRLLLVGPYEQELDPLPDNVLHFIQNDKRVIAAGYQRDVRPWMMASDVFVFPSYREGFPNVVMQAACLEVPCVVSNINGCNEIIEHHVSGMIVPAKDAEALYESMGVMASDKEKRKTFGNKARDFVSINFDQQFVWRALLNVYTQSLQSKNPD